jgi:chromosome segregation ATPase
MIWEYSNSLSARIAEIDFNARNAIGGVDDKDAAIGVLSETADSIRELADEKQESAQSLEDGFGHSTSQSEELAQQAEDLTAWASEVENAEIPDDPDPEEVDCETCDGTGQIIEEGDCPDCDGQGHPDEATEEQLDTWRDEVTSALETVLDSCPV